MKTSIKTFLFFFLLGGAINLWAEEGPVYNFNFYNGEVTKKDSSQSKSNDIPHILGRELLKDSGKNSESMESSTSLVSKQPITSEKGTFRLFTGFVLNRFSDDFVRDGNIENMLFEAGFGEDLTSHLNFSVSFLMGNSSYSGSYDYTFYDDFSGTYFSYSYPYKSKYRFYGAGLSMEYVFNPDNAVSFTAGLAGRYLVGRNYKGRIANGMTQYTGVLRLGPQIQLGSFFLKILGEAGVSGVKAGKGRNFTDPELTLGGSARFGFRI